MLKDVILGGKLRERRLERGWSKEDVATLYGQYIQPIKARTILAIEEGFVPKDPKRRLVLAGIFGLAPAVLGLSPVNEKIIPLPKARHIDLQESKAALLHYWKEGYDDPKAAIKDLYTRTASIQSTVLYKAGPEREEMLQTLCGYKLWLGHLFREQGYHKNALHHYNNAIVLAHEEDLPVFEAAALLRRGEFFFDLGKLEKAEKDFDKALSIRSLPPQVEGRIKAQTSLTKSHLAQTDKEKTAAWNLLQGVDDLANAPKENQLYCLRLSIGGFHVYRARVFMGPAIKKLRDPDKASESLEEIDRRKSPYLPDYHRLYSYGLLDNSVVEAQIERDKGYYPLAVERAMTAVQLSTEMHTIIHIPMLKGIYEDLCASSYGKDVSVAELGLQLLMLEYSHMFH